ncbi:28S ribosomal protein S11, mitochondrial [Orussus abietinus]|uniref:28S ribosomal protein S11, mitochondrial n=1 Tax=Orussus abietinus TaxID=222816 RepID=UPI000625E00B|nr:28S ribosomal protein S11, mitochondrial [Orussus abietinus]
MLKSALRVVTTPNVIQKATLRCLPNISNSYELTISRCLHATTVSQRKEERKAMLDSMPVDDGTEGEKYIDIDKILSKDDIYPNERNMALTFNGVAFKKLPICNIRVSHNNTIMTICSHDGLVHKLRSCGLEGFKNAKKGTNIAAQATAIKLSKDAVNDGFKDVRVRVRGLGPGRMSAIKGLQMGGLNIISITDATRVSPNPPRARKVRRI